MSTEFIQVDDSRAVIALGRFRLSLQENQELMEEIGASMLVSVRRTFREGGSPAGSWVPLSPNTIKRNPRLYGAGHKLLIVSGRLLNSITYQAFGGGVVIGTSLKYAPPHQFGSRDRGVAIGPQTKVESNATVDVAAHNYQRLSAELGTGQAQMVDKNGKTRTVRRNIIGPRNASMVRVRSHQRHQNIPPRPYLVFRPEDPARIRGIVVRYVDRVSAQSGLGGGQ